VQAQNVVAKHLSPAGLTEGKNNTALGVADTFDHIIYGTCQYSKKHEKIFLGKNKLILGRQVQIKREMFKIIFQCGTRNLFWERKKNQMKILKIYFLYPPGTKNLSLTIPKNIFIRQLPGFWPWGG
jgi:hypothetical protein